MTDRILYVEKDGIVPMTTSPTLGEIGRHVSDRNDLGPLDSPATLAVCVLAKEYIERHSEDFEEARTDRREWHYRGTTDADPLPYTRLQYVDVPAHDDADGGDDTVDDDSDTEDGDTERAVARVDGDDEGEDGKLTFTLGEGPPDE